jgi:hypothetical protein
VRRREAQSRSDPRRSQAARSGQGRPIELQLIMDNYTAHKRVEVRNWLVANPR